jgi:hypothetical protein
MNKSNFKMNTSETFIRVIALAVLMLSGLQACKNGGYLENAMDALDAARCKLKILHEGFVSGEKKPRWEGSYLPAKGRPNNGFPTLEMLNLIEKNLEHLNQ